MVVRLAVRKLVDLDALQAGITLPLIRIVATVRLITPAGPSGPREGIVDTGNPVSLIPRRAWSEASVEFLTHASLPIYGLGATSESAIRGRLGRLALTIEDRERSSPRIETVAYLLDDDRAPLLLGCEGILTRAILRTNLAALEASLEF